MTKSTEDLARQAAEEIAEAIAHCVPRAARTNGLLAVHGHAKPKTERIIARTFAARDEAVAELVEAATIIARNYAGTSHFTRLRAALAKVEGE